MEPSTTPYNTTLLNLLCLGLTFNTYGAEDAVGFVNNSYKAAVQRAIARSQEEPIESPHIKELSFTILPELLKLLEQEDYDTMDVAHLTINALYLLLVSNEPICYESYNRHLDIESFLDYMRELLRYSVKDETVSERFLDAKTRLIYESKKIHAAMQDPDIESCNKEAFKKLAEQLADPKISPKILFDKKHNFDLLFALSVAVDVNLA